MIKIQRTKPKLDTSITLGPVPGAITPFSFNLLITAFPLKFNQIIWYVVLRTLLNLHRTNQPPFFIVFILTLLRLTDLPPTLFSYPGPEHAVVEVTP